jgi:hypothetical protein
MEQLDFFVKLEEKKPICLVCGNSFEKYKNKICCSKDCSKIRKQETEKIREQEKAKRKQKVIEKCICPFCCGSFYKTKHNKIFCSLLCKNSKWNKENPQKLKQYKKEDYKKNKEKRYATNNKYRQENKESLNEKNRKNYAQNANLKLSQNIRRRMRETITLVSKKTDSTMNLLGCTIQEAREYLEKKFKEGMTWENHGLYGWHIDHIIPCASFDLTDPEQQKKCFHYTNLQPLWAAENMSKGAKIL